ncbi:glucosamine-6-phosphate deaminase [Lunatibacter salilacus]|uniref:glucosamine-6-phosphate deaminase n=1 Tax=Lunatibacter salilacus TaxID=2483804 RepID=UPI00131C4335|nr:glucosamine-6-phosphate deaminase [Lunatibacter salilacus]
MTITTLSSVEDLNIAAAELFIKAVRLNPKIVLGFSTGNSPKGIYQLLIQDHLRNKTSYKSVTTFNLDEYEGLDGSSEQSYRYFMDTHLFDHLDIDKSNTHVPSGLGDLEAGSRIYDEMIEKAGGIDLQLIGIGTNGHIAFNEPGTPFNSRTHIANLTEETIEANYKDFLSKDGIPKRAVTMGIQSIMEAKQLVMVAFGKNKAGAIKKMIEGPIHTDMPASILQKHPNVTIFLDQEAASLLKK